MRSLSPAARHLRASRPARICLLPLVARAVAASPSPAGGPRPPGHAARLLVTFRPGVAAQNRVLELTAVGAHAQSTIHGLEVQVVTVPSSSAAGALAQLKKTPGVEFAEPDFILAPQDNLPSDPSFPQTYAI